VEIRNGAKANRHLGHGKDDLSDGTHSGLLKSSDSAANWKASRNSLPPAWVDQIEQAEDDVSKIQVKSKQ
jgi:hypothetical protein